MNGSAIWLAAAVAAGGAAGAVIRTAALRFGKPEHRIPYVTLAVNVTGSFLLGWVAATPSLPAVAAVFWMTGVLGGFTTYSTFAVEAASAASGSKGGLRRAVLYIILTLTACTLAAGIGMAAR